jgi:hypothetical protein
MRSYKSFSDGSFLRKADVAESPVWTITNVEERVVTAPGKEPKDKLVLFFDGTKKGLVLNMSNGDTLCELTGHEDPEEWIGQTVQLYVDDTVAYAGKRVGGVRLRKPKEGPF